MNSRHKKTLILLLIASVIALIFFFDLHSLLTLENIKASQAELRALEAKHPILTSLVYILTYITVAALSIPGATILTLLGGAIFGPLWGTLYIAIGATTGAALAFLSARFVLRDSLEAKYADKLSSFNKGIEENAVNYVLFLRLVPLFPFFFINLALGLTRLPLRHFFIASFIGMLPGIFVYANAGSQLANLTTLSDIASPQVLGAFALLGLFALIPVAYKKIKTK